jgi:AraC-like DNA-binding protein
VSSGGKEVVTLHPQAEPFVAKRPSVSSRLVARLTAAAASRGVDGDGLCRAVGLAPEDVRDLDSRIDANQYLALWGEAMAAIDDPAFPLEVAADGGEVHNFLQILCMTCTDVGEGLRRASRFLRILTDGVTWSFDVDGPVATYRIERAGPSRLVGVANEFSAAAIVTMARRFTGVPWAPREVWFAHAAPSDTQAHHLFFRCPVRFSRPHTELHIDASALRIPLVKADPSVGAFLEQYAEKLMSVEPSALSLAETVKRYVGSALRGDAPTLNDAAVELGMSARTLRRRLQAEGKTFQLLLDEMRFAVAKQHLAGGRLARSEIAFLLGFSGAPAFHRAFRRWTGMSAQAYQRSTRSL